MDKESLLESKIYEILEIVLKKIKGKSFIWRLEGSFNLLVQGLKVSVRDIDITTNLEGISIFREALKDYLKKDFYNEKTQAKSLVCDINKAELEINSYNDKKLNFFDKIINISWKDLNLPILPLEEAKIFYSLINKKEKVEIIDKYLRNHS